MMAVVSIYTTKFCPYCVRAKRLLDSKGISYQETPVDGRTDLRRELAKKSGQHTVPQIWIDKQHVGGCDELMLLERKGQLDVMLAS